jgi:hypothetical protein
MTVTFPERHLEKQRQKIQCEESWGCYLLLNIFNKVNNVEWKTLVIQGHSHHLDVKGFRSDSSFYAPEEVL